MDKLCKIRDLQRAVHQFESAFEKRYGICLNAVSYTHLTLPTSDLV